MSPNSVNPAGQLEAVLLRLRGDFLAELPERCNRLEQAVLALEGGQGAEAAYEELFRNVHSLKGTGGTFGLQTITTICHQFESFLSDSHSRYTQAFGSAALAYVDLLRQVGDLAAATASPDFTAVEAALERLRTTLLRSRARCSSPSLRPACAAFISSLWRTCRCRSAWSTTASRPWTGSCINPSNC